MWTVLLERIHRADLNSWNLTSLGYNSIRNRSDDGFAIVRVYSLASASAFTSSSKFRCWGFSSTALPKRLRPTSSLRSPTRRRRRPRAINLQRAKLDGPINMNSYGCLSRTSTLIILTLIRYKSHRLRSRCGKESSSYSAVTYIWGPRFLKFIVCSIIGYFRCQW